MRTIFAALAVIAVLASPPSARAAGCDGIPCVDLSVPYVVIRIKPDRDTNVVLAQINQIYPGVSIVTSIESRRMYGIQLPPGVSECDAHATIEDALVDDPRQPEPQKPLLWVEAGYVAIAGEGHTGSVFDSRRMPYEANYTIQYAVGQLNIGTAHSYSRGGGVTIAVLDTGIDAAHPALTGFVRSDGVNFIRENGRDENDTRDIGDGIDSNGNGRIDEMTGHGTFVAGLLRITAPDAQLLPIIVLDSDGDSDCFVICQGLFAAIDAGAQVINCSLGTTYDSVMFQDALFEARERGITVVGAGGNRGLNQAPALNCPEFPGMTQFERRQQADIPIGIAVSYIQDNNQRVSTSSYYAGMWLSASGGSTPLPGSPDEYDATRSILSTLPDNDYGVWEGSSFACAFVSGGAALLHAQHPFWPASAETHDNIRNLMRNTAVNIDAQNPGYAGLIGPRLNVAALLRADIPGDLDSDSDVDLQDLAFLLADFSETGARPADIDGDGLVTLQDLAYLLGNYGR